MSLYYEFYENTELKVSYKRKPVKSAVTRGFTGLGNTL